MPFARVRRRAVGGFGLWRACPRGQFHHDGSVGEGHPQLAFRRVQAHACIRGRRAGPNTVVLQFVEPDIPKVIAITLSDVNDPAGQIDKPVLLYETHRTLASHLEHQLHVCHAAVRGQLEVDQGANQAQGNA